MKEWVQNNHSVGFCINSQSKETIKLYTYFILATGRGLSSYGVFGERLALFSTGAESLLLVNIHE